MTTVVREFDIDFSGLSDVNPYTDSNLDVVDGAAVRILSGTCRSTNSTLTRRRYNGSMAISGVITSAAEVTGFSSFDYLYIGLFASDGSGYIARVETTTSNLVIFAIDDVGGLTSVNSGAVTLSSGDIVELSLDLDTGDLEATQNGVVRASGNDATYSSGLAFGFGYFSGNSGGTYMASWGGDGIAASGDTATVTEGSLTDGGTISGTYTKTSEWTSSDPTEGTVDGVALTNFSATGGAWSADLPDVYSIAEGLTYPATAAVPDFGTVDVVIGDGTYDAPAVSKAFNVKSGWAEVVLATVDTVTTEGLYLRINATVTPDRDIATGDKIYYDTVSGDVTVTDDGLYSLDGATNDFDFAVISATNNVDEAFQFSNLANVFIPSWAINHNKLIGGM